jgi:ApaG protein
MPLASDDEGTQIRLMSEDGPKSRPTPEGLFVTLDELSYTHNPIHAPADKPHLFAYHLTIHNQSETTVTILARKWIIAYEDGEMDVIEGDKVIGRTPELQLGQSFSYSSFHLLRCDASARGAFHGIDADGTLFSVPMPDFKMTVPGDSACN